MRARVLAHYVEHNTREGYAAEKAKESASTEKKAPSDKPQWASRDFFSYRQGGGRE